MAKMEPAGQGADERGGERLPSWSVALAMAVALTAVVQQVQLGLNPDTSWLITVSERMLAGDRLYVDILELNPPASVYLYLPWVAAADWLGLRAELVVASAWFALAVGAIVLAGTILRRSLLFPARSLALLLPATAVACLLVVGNSFAQREHAAVLALLPWLALMMARAEERSIAWPLAVMAGVGAGLAAVIKPHFLLAALLPLLAAAWKRRTPAVLFGREMWAAAALMLAYLASVILAFPVFFEIVVPMVADGYLNVRRPLSELLLNVPLFSAYLATGTMLLLQQRGLRFGHSLMPLLAALGFGAAMLLQGKGFTNHSYPVIAMALLALAVMVARARFRSDEQRLGLTMLAALGLFSSWAASHMKRYPDVAAILYERAPPRPSMILAGANLMDGHPLTRWVDGRWVGTRASIWATGTAVELLARTSDPAHRRRLQAQIDEDRRIFVSDVLRHRPDVILVEAEHGARWIRRERDVAAAVRPYEEVGRAQNMIVLVRRR